ncbi:ATP-binding cassette domain-containing protein [Arthrobacter sp. I2-34]|uniref:ATP-binding cassette domain-containing protein n=1 Tax=Arthrobacter hankyongi TaxID=2904801 RepID=A0ABS9L4Y9_9MICC|nr:ATP-binding cassette domain-containing protein [Arthrobacter hankyongi]MCG2621747.1 ATP-binding cassette domain-containing protein [Arthrobacter hankyongi]
MVCFRNVSKLYPGGQPAVENLTLDIDRGAITVFVGPSGCGKTTSLRMINRMVEPSAGTVLVDGTDVARRPAAALRRTMGYVMQSAGLLPHRTVLDNIATVPRLNGVPKAQARRRARELLDVVGLSGDLGGRYPAQLSGGQQQRVGVARALAADPPILLMDEPFSAVDPVVRAELQQELLRLQQDLAKTIVFVTHDIDEAVVLGDKVAVFATGGRLAQFAPPAEILRAPVDDFVAGFVGRDRGFRALGFDSADGLVLEPARTAAAGSLADAAPGGWLLVTDDAGRPAGWLPPGARGHGAVVTGGSLFVLGSSLRQALDSALSSPSGKGVAVDAGGRVAGLVDAGTVLRLIRADRHA